MPFHIKKPRLLETGTLYYEGDAHWTDTYANRKQYASNPSSLLINNDGTNGGFTGASVVTE